MNLLQNIFFEFFNKNYYANHTGRAYVEYICEKGIGFQGKVCFFHFSDLTLKLNAKFDLEILKFIKLFYSNALSEIFMLMKYAIDNDIVSSINSINEYEFVIKFWNQSPSLRKLLEFFIKKYTGHSFIIESDDSTRFFEICISIKQGFHIVFFKIYSEKSAIENLPYQKNFLDENNISMFLDIQKIEFMTVPVVSNGLLIKLINPICFSESEYLMNSYFPFLSHFFDKKNIYCSFIETGFGDELIYFTTGYSVHA